MLINSRLAFVLGCVFIIPFVSFPKEFVDDFESYKVRQAVDTSDYWEVMCGSPFSVVDSSGNLAAGSNVGKCNVSVVKPEFFSVLPGQNMTLEADYNVAKGSWRYGVVFLVQDNNRNYYEFSMSGKGQEVALFLVKGKNRKELFKQPLALGAGSGKITVTYDAKSTEITVAVTGSVSFSKTVKDDTFTQGKVGIVSIAHAGYHVTRFSAQSGD